MLSKTDTPERKLEVMYFMKSVVDLHKLKQNLSFDFHVRTKAEYFSVNTSLLSVVCFHFGCDRNKTLTYGECVCLV